MYFKPFPKILGKRLNYLLVDKYAKNFNSIIMNECFLLGTIINKVDFRFAIGGKHDSIIEFKLQLENGDIIVAKAYDKIADYCYQNITKNKLVMIRGKLESDFKIDMSEIYFFRTKGVKEFGK